MAPEELNYYKAISADPAARSQHVLMMLDYFVDSRSERPKCHMVFEYLDDSLFRVFKNRRGLIEHRCVVRYTHQICKGLAFLHQCGTAHMDLSMANVLLRRDESVKICDLGCSTPAAGVLSFESEQISTEYARAPEVWLGGSHAGSACDVWSLGVIAAALLTGTLLFYVGDQEVPWKPGPVRPEMRRLARPATPAPLLRQMAVLGPMTEATWPGCSALPRFNQYVGEEAGEVTGAQPGTDWFSDVLGNPSFVLRCLATSDRGLHFLRRLLVWAPGDRGAAAALTDDPFFNSGHWLEPTCETALALASREDLVHWVRGALRSGRPLSMDMLLTNQPSDPPDQLPRSGSARGVEPEVPGPSFAVPASTRPADQPDQLLDPLDQKLRSGSASGAEPGGREPLEPLPDQMPRSGSACGAKPGVLGLHLCRCVGHCGTSLCSSARGVQERKRNKRKLAGEEDLACSQETPKAGLFCKRAALPGSDFCALCKCERWDCQAPRKKAMRSLGTDGRWCRHHAQEASSWEQQSRFHYANAFGFWKTPRTWSTPLQMAARYSYAFERLIPEDVLAFRQFCGAQPADLAKWSGAPGSAQWCWLSLANRAKWPHAVRSLAEFLANRPNLWHAASIEDFAQGVRAMLCACDGKPMKSMHSQLSLSGHMHSTQGLVPLAKQAGLIKELGSSPQEGNGRILRLGLGGSQYVLADEDRPLPKAHASARADSPSRMAFADRRPERRLDPNLPPSAIPPSRQATMDFFHKCEEGGHAAHSQLEWPISLERLPAVLDTMKPLIASTLDLGPRSDYTEKYLLRKMLIVLGEDRWGPQTIDPLTVERILAWVPDSCKHLAPLRAMTGREVRHLCGFSAPWVSCWACVGQKTVDTAVINAFARATPMQLLRLTSIEDV